MTEKLTQLGLLGFGKEVASQLASETPALAETQQELFVIPQNTTIFRRLNPDLGSTTLSSLYVTKKVGTQVERGMIRVVVADEAQVYRDGQRFNLSKGEVVEVPVRRLVKKS